MGVELCCMERCKGALPAAFSRLMLALERRRSHVSLRSVFRHAIVSGVSLLTLLTCAFARRSMLLIVVACSQTEYCRGCMYAAG